MRYFVTQITTVNGQTAIAVTPKDSLKDAKMMYHQILASAYVTPGMEYFLVYIETDTGEKVEQDFYRYVPQVIIPTPEPEEPETPTE